MKHIAFTLTLLFHFFIIVNLKLLDHFYSIILIIVTSAIIGFAIRKFPEGKETNMSNIGSGIFNGSITYLILLAIFTFWLSNNFPG